MAVRSALMNVMFKAAEKAARGLVRDFGEIENLQVSRKGQADFVSNADYNSQKIIHKELSLARPGFGFLMEEDDGSEDTSSKPERWIVDPLDGTINFLHGLPHWNISIAAERNGEVIAGLVYAPISNEAFWAEKGCGAYSNNNRLRVSSRKDFSECLISCGIPYKGMLQRKPNFSKQLDAVMPLVSGIRRFGAAALDLAYLAAGRYDGFWEERLDPWDIAAGILIVREAGGLVSSIEPDKNPIYSGGMVASNYEIHNQLLNLIREAV
ncbi:MAG: inositol monophosphatase [Alphaproteobacteria bacterium]|nr:inositol monophosphatase [Alphaproteobacteria bacterium]